MQTRSAPLVSTPSCAQRFLRFPLTRMVLAVFVVAVAGGLPLTWLGRLARDRGQTAWPALVAVAVMIPAYALYVRLVERRPATELGTSGALPELGAGLLAGVVLVASVAALVAATGAYRITGIDAWSTAILAPLAMMGFVGVFEELVSRAVVFRIAEESLGSWAALAVSSLLFGLAHLPGEGAGLLAIAITAVAGVLFASAYMLTRRIWLAVGIHVAWNCTLGSILSVAVSGRESRGLLVGRLSGPEWITGGAYGFEASIATLLVLAIVSVVLLRACWKKGRWIRRVRSATAGVGAPAGVASEGDTVAGAPQG